MSESVRIVKVDTDRQYVFGWANVAVNKQGMMIEDLQGDMIDPEDLEEAAYHFCLDFGMSGEMHQGASVGALIESFVVTPDKLSAMGLAADILPRGWWIGFHIDNPAAFAKIKDGTYTMFSIQGHARREEV